LRVTGLSSFCRIERGGALALVLSGYSSSTMTILTRFYIIISSPVIDDLRPVHATSRPARPRGLRPLFVYAINSHIIASPLLSSLRIHYLLLGTTFNRV
jgi:hypothetical protein